MQTHSLADWSAFLMLGVSGYAAFSAPYFLLVDADASDFDPRPVVVRAVKAVHQEFVHAGHVLAWAAASARHEFTPAVVPVRHAAYVVRELARDVAALLILLTSAPKKGAL
ncbi:hypothetical protein O3Q52_17230 [Streptomyces sp. ActVer]|uniref:hypothetical protein n=1 Tax=Streptomyces sp. ActVer TaxID=3014558 RepID=UPI0022B2D384|nr:hypothetical protein [Streptomyces sp. ActVer]MCZ4509907.1 hypothetical protein [Streptomyces sp. ActVer]